MRIYAAALAAALALTLAGCGQMVPSGSTPKSAAPSAGQEEVLPPKSTEEENSSQEDEIPPETAEPGSGTQAPTNQEGQASASITQEEALALADGCARSHFDSPVMLVVSYDPADAWIREEDGKNHGEIDAAIATTQMMLQAADLGLGTTYIGMFDPEKLRAAFPEELAGLVPIALLALGYPAENARPSRLHTERKPLEEMVRYR